MTTKTLTCIGCPMGCQVTVQTEGADILSVTGNSCAVGERYARQELFNPQRTVTSTVVVRDGRLDRCPVKTDGMIPKGRIMECMAEINRITVTAPVKSGQVLLDNVCGTGVAVIATRAIRRRS
jgi:CxxC motif-containing protein